MSKRNGDRARFQKDRKRKLFHRQQIQALKTGRGKKVDASGAALAATLSGNPCASSIETTRRLSWASSPAPL